MVKAKVYPVSETLRNWHIWGCLSYILEPKFQNYGEKVSKWYTRSQIGVNMGLINMHSSQVGIFINRMTGLISS